ncbi:(d)CMP kinase [Gammaproteobacteria bacterium]|nr:(d)CMP kinase [Gammaproteobacteria bacterium]
MKTHKIPVITIDGASGTGKGVVTQEIAKQLGWNFLDSGVIYRALAFVVQKHSIKIENEPVLVDLALNLDLEFYNNLPNYTILLEGQDVTNLLRDENIGNLASKIGSIPSVRQALLAKQRSFSCLPGLVTDGRDMGTVIFPDAALKIFLTASPLNRAQRRHNQLKDMGIHANLSDLVKVLKERDDRDQKRSVAPLKPASDAVSINTDKLNISQVVDCVITEAKKVLSLL